MTWKVGVFFCSLVCGDVLEGSREGGGFNDLFYVEGRECLECGYIDPLDFRRNRLVISAVVGEIGVHWGGGIWPVAKEFESKGAVVTHTKGWAIMYTLDH